MIRSLIQRISPLLAFTTLIFSSGAAMAQNRVHDHNANTWLMFMGSSPIKDSPLGIHYNAHIRRTNYGFDWQQYLLESGLDYKAEKFKLSGGYGYMETFRYGDHPALRDFSENRIYQQIAIPMQALGVDWTGRLRLEQRFIETFSNSGIGTVDRSTRFENRIRLMLGTQIPFSLFDNDNCYFTASNEVFINTGGGVALNTFDQNRAYVGVGYKLSPSMKLELGFMEQTLQHRDGRVWEHNHTLNLTLHALLPIH